MTNTKERPILFSGPMVRALLDGSKTQTRRTMRPQPPAHTAAVGRWQDPPGYDAAWWAFVREGPVEHDHPFAGAEIHGEPWRCPYGKPGEKLWVRETFRPIFPQDPAYNGGRPIEYDYAATYTHGYRLGDSLGIKKAWKPSIHMPRDASRITLEVTEVRVERLQDISEADAQAEGCAMECMTPTGDDSGSAIHGPGGYIALWESINGPGSWEANPWVWAVSFRRIK